MGTIIEQLLARQSCPKLKAPAPSSEELDLVLQCGMKAPDHGRLKPWRFVVLSGGALVKLGEAFAAAKETAEPLTEDARNKLLNMPLRAPMIIVAIADIKEHPKVPPIEQVVAVGCAVQNMQLALASLGYGAMWRTGELAFNDEVKRYFKARPEDEIVGFLYVGTPEALPKPANPQQVVESTEFWTE